MQTSEVLQRCQFVAQLQCGSQTYEWGKVGKSSAVARFTASANEGFSIDEKTPYAELWMGTHPKDPSKLAKTGESLRDTLEKHPEYLGADVAQQFGKGELPFLFKVLSISKALSIQAHPDKSLGKILRERDPKNYPDDNHKPEMTIALTDFEGFCGFRRGQEIACFIESVPEFKELTGQAGADFVANAHLDASAIKPHLRALFDRVMNTPQEKVEVLAHQLVDRATKEKSTFAGEFGGSEFADLIIRLGNQFPGDIGLFCGGLMLNYCRLSKGQAMFLKAKDPHAYISGDIIECMAASDNVVRAGFTPKFKDVDTLVNMLTYDSGTVKDQIMQPKSFDKVKGGEVRFYNPPIDEFCLYLLDTKKGGTASLEPIPGASILIVTDGTGTINFTDKNEHTLEYKPGFVYFVAAGTSFEIRTKEETTSFHAVCGV